MLRFLCLYVVVGFVIAQNWIYLFPYLASLDESKFQRLAPFVMLSGYLSETLFYQVSEWLTKRVSHSIALSLVLAIFGLRYSLYLATGLVGELGEANNSQGAGRLAPVELIVLVELLQAPSAGWFSCVINETPHEFAKSLAGPAESLGDRQPADVKLTLLGVSKCCFEGLGVALGSLLGGWLIDRRGYRSLWLCTIWLALLASLANAAFELARRWGPAPAPASSGPDQEGADSG